MWSFMTPETRLRSSPLPGLVRLRTRHRMKAAQRYPESTIFAVPLGDGTYALGLVARRAPRGRILFGYFFGPKLKDIPKLSELPRLSTDMAIDKCQFGDLGLFDGSWPVIGQLRPWNREDWPLPLFYRDEYKYLPPPDPDAKRIFLIKYSDDDPAKLLWERRVPEIPPDALSDGLSGSGFVESYLRDVLDRQVLH